MYVCVDHNKIDKLKEKEEERILSTKASFAALIKGILHWPLNSSIHHCILIYVVFFHISFSKLACEIRISTFKFLYIKCRFHNVHLSVSRMQLPSLSALVQFIFMNQFILIVMHSFSKFVCNIFKAKSMLCDNQDWFCSQLAGGVAVWAFKIKSKLITWSLYT